MKKFRFQSVVGIVFIYLFFVNVILALIGVLTASLGYTVIAFFLSIFQLFLHNNFKCGHLLPRSDRDRKALQLCNPLRFKVLVKNNNNKINNYRDIKLIKDRATNKHQSPFLAVGSFSNPGYMEYERIRYSKKTIRIEDSYSYVSIGTAQCSKPYLSSILNIGAISHETVYKTTVFALSEGAKIGGFAINTGAGGISPYHIRGGGDLIWQIGSQYAGCNNADGTFSEQLFKKNSTRLYVKMIEISLCDAGMPYQQEGLAAVKPTTATLQTGPDEQRVKHLAFTNEIELMYFASLLRSLSGGKPVGVKVCIANKGDFENLCLAMVQTGIFLDFITIEGGRDGSYLQMSLLDALAFSRKLLNKYVLPSKIIASGKIITEYDILRAIALGADLCYSTRGMLLALRENSFAVSDGRTFNELIARFKRKLNSDFDLEDNRVRVASFHKNTMNAVGNLMKLCAYETLSDVQAKDFYRRTTTLRTKTLEDIYFTSANKYNNKENLLTSLN